MNTIEQTLLPIEAGGLKLRNPFIVGSGPTTKTLEQLIEAERCGWAGASIKLAMDPPPYINLPPRYRWLAKEGMHMFTAETRLNMEQSLRLIGEARERTNDLILFANIAYAGPDGLEGWATMARRFEQAGAHAIELNLCCPNMSFNVEHSAGLADNLPTSGASIGIDPEVVATITATVKSACRIPVFAKLSVEGVNMAALAAAAFSANADGVTNAGGWLVVPPFDVNDPGGFFRAQQGMSLACVTGPAVQSLCMRDIFEMRKRIGPEPCILGTGSVASAEDAIRLAMCGADLIGICTATMLYGFAWLPAEIRKVRGFLAEHGLSDWRQLRDRLHPHMRPVHQLDILNAHAVIDETVCTGCGRCLSIGHCCAISMTDMEKARVDPAKCTACSTCMDLCEAGAIRMEMNDCSH